MTGLIITIVVGIPIAFMVGWWVGHKFGVQDGIIEQCGRDASRLREWPPKDGM